MNRAMMALAVLAVTLGGQSVQAQLIYQRPITNPYQTPVFSPYLNLFRGGSPGLNYYGIVRPQEQFYSYMEAHPYGLGAVPTQPGPQQLAATQTGGPATFMSFPYFLNVGGQRVGVPAAVPGGRPFGH
jgi:hypothetical protein